MLKLRPDYAKSNSYGTMQTKGLYQKMSAVGTEIDKMLILKGSSLDNLEIDGNVVVIKGQCDNIDGFAHPYFHNGIMIVDARPYATKEGKIKDIADYEFLKRRALIEHAWITEKVEFGSQADLIADIFASWFSGGITRRMNMTMQEQQYLRILAAIYYLRQLHRESNLSPQDTKITLLRVLPRILRVATPIIEDVFNALDEEEIQDLYCYQGEKTNDTMYYLNQLFAMFNKLTDNVYRIDFTVMNNSLPRGAFICSNGTEIASMAIEFPPLFILMCWYCINKGIQNNTGIGRIVGSVVRKHNEEKFLQFMNSLIK